MGRTRVARGLQPGRRGALLECGASPTPGVMEITMLTVADVRKEVDRIRELGEHGARNADAHIADDELRGKILEAIADGGCEYPRECARIALETDDFPFSRWYE